MGKVSKQRKVTNAYLAKLLGWKKSFVVFQGLRAEWKRPDAMISHHGLPDFLHDIEMVILECERLDVMWELCSQLRADCKGRYRATIETEDHIFEQGAALALATALARYLESMVP